FLGLNEAAVAALKFVAELGVHQHLSNAWNELTERLRRLNGRRPSISRCCILSARESDRTRGSWPKCGNWCCRRWSATGRQRRDCRAAWCRATPVCPPAPP